MTETCRHGHEMTSDNTLHRTNGWRGCRACQNDQNRKSYMRHRDRIRERRRRPRLSATEKAARDAARFWAKVEKTADCWFWRATRTRDGYGTFYFYGRSLSAHRWLYQQLIGPVPDGLVLDHLCRIRHCVNPQHLEPVTHRENVIRGMQAATKETQ
jgi:hypothetical protein